MRLIDADALIEHHCEGCSHEIREGCKTDPVCATLLWLVEASTIEVPQWIPVTERLPEDGEMIVATVNGKPRNNIKLIGAYQMATYYHGEGWVVELFPDWTEADVTHWMPLPEPPKDGGAENATEETTLST